MSADVPGCIKLVAHAIERNLDASDLHAHRLVLPEFADRNCRVPFLVLRHSLPSFTPYRFAFFIAFPPSCTMFRVASTVRHDGIFRDLARRGWRSRPTLLQPPGHPAHPGAV